MGTKKPKGTEVAVQATAMIDEVALFERVSAIIENRKHRIQTAVNYEATLMYWEVGQHINDTILENKRAEYGRRVVATLAQQLQAIHGNSFEYTNVRRMMQLAERFPEFEIVVPLAQQLSWSHFIALLPVKSDEAFMYYAGDAVSRRLGKRELRKQISRKAYERREISNLHLSEQSKVPLNVFKDPFLLDTLGLKENYLEADLERAILTDMKKFILEFGRGFAFVDEQVRMTMDGDDFKLDLLFFHRDLKRLVAIELKLGKFKPIYKGQMEFYLRWLNKFERREGEHEPIGLILCTEAGRDQIELMELDTVGIAVAEYWTELPPKAVFETKIKEIMEEAQERLERRKDLPKIGEKKIEYFLEAKDDDDDE